MEFYVPFFKYPVTVEFEDVIDWKVIDPSESIRTGDILLFSGSAFVSSIIKLFTVSKWNHVGMACWCELTYRDGSTGIDLFSFELGSQPFTDLMTRKMADKEVRLVRLADIADMYDMIAVRKLNSVRKTSSEKRAWASRFQEFMLHWKKTPFFDLKVLLRAHFISAGAPKHQTTCAQIAARMIDHMGVKKIEFDDSQVCPEDYTACSKAFPEGTFKGSEAIVYRHLKWLNIRLIYIGIILLFILIVLVVLIRKHYKTRSVPKT